MRLRDARAEQPEISIWESSVKLKQRVFVVSLLALCALPAAGQRTNVARDMPLYDNGGKPDLAIDEQRLVAQMQIVDRLFVPGECAVLEGTVGGTGYRRLLRFDTVILNRSTSDLVIGNRADAANPFAAWFYFDNCHKHYHLRDFSVYELLKPDGTLATQGTKQGFCMEDSLQIRRAKEQRVRLREPGNYFRLGGLVLQAASGAVDRHHGRTGGRVYGADTDQ